MSEHKAKQAEGIVTSDAVQGGRRFSLPKRVLLPLIAVVVLAVLGGAGFAYKTYVYDPAHKKTTAASKSDRNSNDYLLHPDKQISAAQAELNSAKTPQEKATAYDHLAQAYFNGNKLTDAVDAANSSLSADSSTTNKLQALSVLGYSYSRDGQKDKAIAAFQQMIDIIKASNDEALKEDMPRVQAAITEIQQGQTL